VNTLNYESIIKMKRLWTI